MCGRKIVYINIIVVLWQQSEIRFKLGFRGGGVCNFNGIKFYKINLKQLI